MPSLFPGQNANVDAQGRAAIPLDLLRAVNWWPSKWPEKRIRVGAELVRRGLLRLYPDRAVRELVQAREAEALSEGDYISNAVLADRYRELALYKDGRLRLTKEICPWLGFSLGEKATLYAQPFENGLEVMSMQHRFDRLSEVASDPLPWTFQAVE